jgi:hypothetical protein
VSLTICLGDATGALAERQAVTIDLEHIIPGRDNKKTLATFSSGWQALRLTDNNQSEDEVSTEEIDSFRSE